MSIIEVLGNGDLMVLLGNRRMELGAFYIKFEIQIIKKDHTLAYIIVKFSIEDLNGSKLNYGPDKVELPIYNEDL